jgi:hypothetical protein
MIVDPCPRFNDFVDRGWEFDDVLDLGYKLEVSFGLCLCFDLA